MDVADADAARANVAGVDGVDADAVRANVAGVDVVNADRGIVSRVNFAERVFLGRMLQPYHGERGLQWRRPSRCAITP